MAEQKILKGFRQVNGLSSDFSLDKLSDGIIYFIRTSSTGEDGYIYFDGKQYGTANDKIVRAEYVVVDEPTEPYVEEQVLYIPVSSIRKTESDKNYLIGNTDISSDVISFTQNGWYRNSNIYVQNNTVYAQGGFYETSDARKKNFGEDIKIDFEELKSIPKKYFSWKDDEDGELHVGTSAQGVLRVYPDLVSHDDETDTYSVAYDKLSIVALAAVDRLHEENQELKSKVSELEERLAKLEESFSK